MEIIMAGRKHYQPSVVWFLVFAFFLAEFTIAQEEAEGPEKQTTAEDTDADAMIEDFRRRLETLEKQLGDLQASDSETRRPEVDLSDEPTTLHGGEEPSSVLARPWYQNFSIWGYGAADYLITGEVGKHPDGDFAVREAAIFIEAEATEQASFLFEIRSDYKAYDKVEVTTGEVYAHLRNVLQVWGDDLLGIKIGRFDVPFSEEYHHDPPVNPLITHSAHWLYATDEGIEFYGKLHGLGWIVAVMDGTAARNIDDDADKAVSVKVHGRPSESIYLSASFMRNGRTERSALRFGGSMFQPVGSGDPSALGVSPSEKVNAVLYALDARWTAMDRAHIALSFGQAFVDDREPGFDRDFLWFSVEALYQFTPAVYGSVRYSEIGTYDPDKGYHFDGKYPPSEYAPIGYDAKRLQRLAVGLGWKPHPNLLVKVEGGTDRYEVIRASTVDSDNGQRWFAGAEIVLSF